jgi:phage head maturation protease
VPTAEDVAFHGETASLVVGQAQSSGTVHRAEDAVLLEQIDNDRLLVSIDPAREQQEEEGERVRQRVHGGSLPQCRAAFNPVRDGPSSAGTLG